MFMGLYKQVIHTAAEVKKEKKRIRSKSSREEWVKTWENIFSKEEISYQIIKFFGPIIVIAPKKKKAFQKEIDNIVHKDLIFTKEASENNRKTAYLISNTEIKC